MALRRLLQANINHCARAQDLLLQSMAQWSIDVAVVAEPYFVPPRDDWVCDTNRSVALIMRSAADTLPFEAVTRGRGYVAAIWGNVMVVGVYFAPSLSLADMEDIILELGTVVSRSRPRPVIVLGDFNAKSTAWGSPATDARGELVEEWAVEQGLLLLNRGSVQTCVRQGGGSIVDLSFASPALARTVQDWHVLEEVETLSDHRYIRFSVSAQTSVGPVQAAPVGVGDGPRWALKRLDGEALLEASIVKAWLDSPGRPTNIDDEAEWFRESMSHICDAGMPRVRPLPSRRQVYWWSQSIAQLRIACVHVRRRYARCRRRRRRRRPFTAAAEQEEAELYNRYREAKSALKLAIVRAKAQAHEELLETLDREPWGRPYLMVRGKLRQWAPPLSRSLQPQLLEEVVCALFPSRPEHTPPAMVPPHNVPDAEDDIDDDVPEVTRVELRVAVARIRNTAPGPDGIPGRAWVLAMKALGPRLAGLLSACLERGQFPSRWKTGKLVLLKKEGRPADSPSAYRPIVLLDEVCKIFERIIASRLIQHMTRVGPDLADNQFGFRQGRSTVDAIMRARVLAEEAVARGEVVLAVSLDIANAFNTLPWSTIREALRYHGVPRYLQRIVGAYLSERSVVYPGREGWGRRETSCGVPQGSVLGPLLWNVGYDWALRGALLHGVGVICYADDTLVTARGKSYRQAAIRATAGVAHVVGRIRRLGLEVALHKSEALCFHGPRMMPPPGSSIIVGGVSIAVESTMKYLGLVLDSRWNFGPHFTRLAPRLLGAASALSRLLPNLGGPDSSCRRLYMGVIRSMALYAAPVWADALTARNVAALRRPQRAMAVRIIRGYRTISFEAASLLAGSPPWDLDAKLLASLYWWRAEAVERGERLVPRQVEARRAELRQVLVAEWQTRLAQPTAGHAVVAAVRPVLEEWLNRSQGALSFRLTQVLTGHGCFGKYLCRIGREPTSQCHHCGDCRDDTALHTLAECPAWAEQRCDLVAAVGAAGNLSLPAVVSTMVGSESGWSAVATFCEAVMLVKEAAEREREAASSLPSRSRRTGRRRVADLRPP